MGDKLSWFRTESQQMDLCDSCLPPVPQWGGGDEPFLLQLLEKGRVPTPVFWPREFHGLYSPLICKESDTTERLSLLTHI